MSFFCVGAQANAQGTIQIGFDGWPSGKAIFIQQYSEAGVWFRPLGILEPGNGFVRNGGGLAGFPENGTSYLQAGLGSSLMFSFDNNSTFDLVSVDLAEYSSVVPVFAVSFIGYRHDGSIIAADMIPDGIIDGTGPLADFQTFYFDSSWNNLTRVEIPTYGWSFDNLVVSIPEPSVCTLLLLGTGFFRTFQNWRKKN